MQSGLQDVSYTSAVAWLPATAEYLTIEILYKFQLLNSFLNPQTYRICGKAEVYFCGAIQ
jgi:hypothetical protein